MLAAIAATLETRHSWLWELTIDQGHLRIHAASSQGWHPHLARAHGPASPASPAQGLFSGGVPAKKGPWLSFMLLAFDFTPNRSEPYFLYPLTSLHHNILPFRDSHRRSINVKFIFCLTIKSSSTYIALLHHITSIKSLSSKPQAYLASFLTAALHQPPVFARPCPFRCLRTWCWLSPRVHCHYISSTFA